MSYPTDTPRMTVKTHPETITLVLKDKRGFADSGILVVKVFAAPEGLEKWVSWVLPTLPVDNFDKFSIPYIVHMIDFGEDEDAIIRHVVGDEVQDSIDAIDRV